ncbi:phosphotransferase [Nocardia sp. NPDC004654]|uniref:phosphotransferase n=1 Tax=Nocardia sp. NPDC004654 TaxID=3154776 RepID=UPI0033A52603
MSAPKGPRMPQYRPACCGDPRFLGAPFLLSERIAGETVPRRVLRSIRTGGLAERVAGQLGEAMARLHAIDPVHAPSALPGEPDADPGRALLHEIHEGVDALLADRFGDDAREFGGLVDRAAYVTAYERAGGAFDLDRFRWWKTASTVAWGVLLARQAAAYLSGETRDIVMAASGRRVSEIEWDLLMQIRPAAA